MNEIPCSHFWLISHATALIWLGLYGAQQSLRIRLWDQGSYSQVPVWTEVVYILDWGTDDQLQEYCHLMAQMSFPLGFALHWREQPHSKSWPLPTDNPHPGMDAGNKAWASYLYTEQLEGTVQTPGPPMGLADLCLHTTIGVRPKSNPVHVHLCLWVCFPENLIHNRYPRWLGSNANKPDGIKIVSERLYRSEGSWSATETR